MQPRTALGVLVSICCWTGAAHGECTSPGFNQGSANSFCNGCRYEGSMVVRHDTACERPYRPSNNGMVVEFLGNRITQRARHGIAGVSGNTLAYQPANGYVGADDFVVEMTYRQGNQTGRFSVHFAVTVQ